MDGTTANERGLKRVNAQPSENTTATNTQIVGQVLSTGNSSPVEKTRANLAAQLALAGGYALLDLADGSFVVTRWNLTRHCVDLQSVARFARQVGAR